MTRSKRVMGLDVQTLDKMFDEFVIQQAMVVPKQEKRERSEYWKMRTEKRREERLSVPFVGVDGEGGNIDAPQMALFGPTTKQHEYLLLRAGEDVLETGKPLTWFECFNFLCDLPKGPEYVSYFFDYDVTMMIRGLTPDRIRRLLRRTRPVGKDGKLLPVDVGPFQLDYLPRKEFKVRRAGESWTVVQDVGTFFQTAFLKSLNKWGVGTDEEREMIRKGKEMRQDFAEVTDETRFYNHLEVRLLSDLMNDFRNICKQLGYIPSRWEGPGLLATAAFRKHRIPKTKTLEVVKNAELMFYARAAYYGGRFETSTVGPTPPTDQWDISSAYPYAMLSLPCLLHGTWEKFEGRPTANLYVAHVDFQSSQPSYFYGLPVRDTSGNISYPGSGTGWYWSDELQEVEGAGYQSLQYHSGWQYIPSCTCRPFSFNEGLYNARRRLGKDTKGYILKLVLNSEYGKLAQSIGTPAYSNPIWAGLITSKTRALILRAIYSTDPSHIHMIATDGIFATKGSMNLPVSDELGGWTKDEHDYMFIIQPGLYFTSTDIKAPKTRGIPQRAVVELRDEFVRQFEAVKLLGNGKEGVVSVELPTFIGGRQALHQDNLSMMGEWVNLERKVTFDWSSKRWNPHYDAFYLRTSPPLGEVGRETIPYGRLIGVDIVTALEGIEAFRMIAEDQPDWVQMELI